jgi:hypothetical protein
MILAIALVLAPAAAAPPPAYPDVQHATYHQLLFANDDVAILNNHYPPQGDSEFHAHGRDLFFVTVTPSTTSAQSPGQPQSSPATRPAGTVGFSAVGANPIVHRVLNHADVPAQFIAVEIRRPRPTGGAVSDRGAGYVQIVDNDRLRAWRVVLAPGARLPSFTQTGHGVRVVVRGGQLRTVRPGVADQTLLMMPGDASWQAAGETRALVNAGGTEIELVEMELK